MPPPGLGRFVAMLAPLCQVILPAGIYEDGERLCVRFGQPYRLEIPAGLTNDQIDEHASLVVMRAIAKLLPERLRGMYQD